MTKIKNYLDVQYDKTEEYHAEIKPLIDEVFDLCEKHKIPFVFYACAKNDPAARDNRGTHTMVGSVRLDGPGRTPFELVAMSAIIERNEKGPEGVAKACLAAGAEIIRIGVAGEIPADAIDEPASNAVH